MKNKSLAGPLLAQIFWKLAPKIGATVVMESEWGIAGQIIFKNGRKRYFRSSTLDLNPVGASDIAKDKGYAAFFMKKLGYPTVPGKTFFSNSWSRAIGSRRNIDAGYRYAKTIGLPVFVKPNSGSQGTAVAKVHTKQQFYRMMRLVFRRDRVALVQPALTGRDFRIVVLDRKVISAYERIPLNLIGDGRSSISQLLNLKQKQFVKADSDTIIRVGDKRIFENLKRQGFSRRSVIPRGQKIYLLDNANLSTGGDAIEVTNRLHPEFKKIAVRLTSDMGLRLCGVDLMVASDIAEKPGRYWILEVNAAPGLDHYAKTGKTQAKIVEAMYLKVLKALE